MTRTRKAALLLLVLTACPAGPNDVAQAAASQAASYWLGLRHGMFASISFIVSLFGNNSN